MQIDSDEYRREILDKKNQFGVSIRGNEILVLNNVQFQQTGVYIPINIWTHVAIAYNYNLKKYKTYLNGKLTCTNILIGNFNINDTPIKFGSYQENKKLLKLCQVSLFFKELLEEDIIKVKNNFDHFNDIAIKWPLNDININGIVGCYNETQYRQDLSPLINNSKYSDIKIYAQDDQFIIGHKVIICHQCPILDSMITTENDIKFDVPYEILVNFITYLYTGSIDFITSQNVLPLYLISDQYIVNLKFECEKFMSLHLMIDNIFDYYVLANTHNSPYLSNHCITWMNNHYKDVINNRTFYKLDPTFIQKFLNKVK